MRLVTIALMGLLVAPGLIAQPADPVVVRARSLIDSGKEQAAVDLLEKAVATKPSDAVLHFWLANAYGGAARQASMFKMLPLARKARGAFETAVRLDPNYLDARFAVMEFHLLMPSVMGGSADEAIEQATQIRKRDAIAGHRAFATIAAAKKDFAAARSEYSAAVRKSPGSALPSYWYGVYLMISEKDYRASAGAFDAALRIDANFMPAYFQIGHLAVLSGSDLARGEGALRKYLTFAPGPDDPPLHRAHYWLGCLYEKQGRKADAREQFRAALRLRPGNPDAEAGLRRVS